MDFFTHVTALTALAVMALQQLIKLNLVPVAFANNHPVPANILLSLGAAIFVVWRGMVDTPHAWTDWLLLVATISAVAAGVYHVTLKNWHQLRAMEGPGKGVAPNGPWQ